MIERQMQATIMSTMQFLTARESLVIDLIYGLTRREPKTRAWVAQIMNVDRSRIGQIESRAIRKLRHPNCFRDLRDLLTHFDK